MFAAFLVEIQIQAQSTAATDEKRAGEDHQQQHLHGPCVQIAFFQLRFPKHNVHIQHPTKFIFSQNYCG